MLSRVAENMYWMARYIERAENTARLIGVNTNLLLDLPKKVAPGWEPLIAISGSLEQYRQNHKGFSERDVSNWLIREKQNHGSILSSLIYARENCRTIRDVVPRQAWEYINELYLYAANTLEGGLAKSARATFLKEVTEGAQSITGLLAGTLNHDEGYDFLRIGRNLERADMTTRIIDVRSQNLLVGDAEELRPYDNIQWISVLKSMTGYQMYRRAVQARVRRADVLMFLFQSPVFPRSFYHAVSSVEQSLAHLPNSDAPLRLIGRLKRLALREDLVDLLPVELAQFVDELQVELGALHQELYQVYFSPPIQSPTSTAKPAAKTGQLQMQTQEIA